MDGQLYFRDKPVGSFHEMNMTVGNESLDDLPEHLSTSWSGEMTMDVELDSLTALSLLSGRRVTNNWLKMHGGVLIRKGLKKRKRASRKKGD
jgi:hypothetical protein